MFLFCLVGGVPFGKTPQPFTQRRGRPEAEILLQRRRVGVCLRHVTGLHRHKFLMRLEIIVCRQHAGTHQLFLKYGYEVEKVLGMAVAYVVNLVRRYGKAVVAVTAFRGVLHDTQDAFNDVVYVGEVAPAVAVIEYPYPAAFNQIVGKAEVGHVGTACRTVHGEEAQARARDVVQLAVGVCHELVAFLRGGVKAYGAVRLVVRAVRHLPVAAVHAARAGVYQVLHAAAASVVAVAAGLKYVVEAYEVACHVCAGVAYAVSHAGLGG